MEDLPERVHAARRELEAFFERLGRVEAEHGPYSDEYRAMRDEYNARVEDLRRISSAFEEFADAWARLRDEYLP